MRFGHQREEYILPSSEPTARQAARPRSIAPSPASPSPEAASIKFSTRTNPELVFDGTVCGEILLR
jgi:hypothetical protein